MCEYIPSSASSLSSLVPSSPSCSVAAAAAAAASPTTAAGGDAISLDFRNRNRGEFFRLFPLSIRSRCLFPNSLSMFSWRFQVSARYGNIFRSPHRNSSDSTEWSNSFPRITNTILLDVHGFVCTSRVPITARCFQYFARNSFTNCWDPRSRCRSFPYGTRRAGMRIKETKKSP